VTREKLFSRVTGHESRAPQITMRYKLLPLLALLLYCGLALHQLKLPGFYYDEALDLPPTLQLIHDQPVELMPHDPGLTLFGRTLPLMILDYLGAVNTYLLLPVFALIGASGVTVRLFEVAIGIIIVALSHRLARAWFGASIAHVTTLLLAVNPSFIFWSRMGISVTSVMAICSLGSLLALTYWKRRGGRYWLVIAGVLLGIGLWAKFLFLWWLMALAAVYFLLELRRWWPTRNKLARGEVLGLSLGAWTSGGIAFLIGAGPLIYFNVLTGKTVENISNALKAPTDHGINNLNVLDNFRAALDQFRIFLDGSYFWYNGEIHSNPWAVRIFIMSLAVVGLLIWRWPRAEQRRTLAVLILMTALIAQSAFTVSGIWATHDFILVPFPQLIVALAAFGLWHLVPNHQDTKTRRNLDEPLESVLKRSPTARTRLAPPARTRALSGFESFVTSSLRGSSGTFIKWATRLFGVVLVLGLFAGDLSTTGRYYASLVKFGGYGRFSDAVYAFADTLVEQQITSPAALDWGLQKNIFVLTNGRVQPIEIFGYSPEPDEGFPERVAAMLCDSCVFISVDPRYAVYPREAAFREIATKLGYEVILDERDIFREHSGQPAYLLYRVYRANSSP
jgi:hypothetical protein